MVSALGNVKYVANPFRNKCSDIFTYYELNIFEVLE